MNSTRRRSAAQLFRDHDRAARNTKGEWNTSRFPGPGAEPSGVDLETPRPPAKPKRTRRRPAPAGAGSGQRFLPGTDVAASVPAPTVPDGRPITARMISERHRLLEQGGWVSGRVVATTRDPRSTRGIKGYWDDHAVAGEYAGPGEAEFPKMPDDYTPGRTGGRAWSGLRRTHRMRYSGAGLDVRMPSVSAIRRFADETGGSFDVPVEVRDASGSTASAWVRVSRTGPGCWHTSGVGFGGDRGAATSEAVAALLESRHPSRALAECGDLVARRREEAKGRGAIMRNLDAQSWIRQAGRDETNQVTMLRANDGSVRGWRTDVETHEDLLTSARPGVVFHAEIKGGEEVEVVECHRCGRVHLATVAHTCPVHRIGAPGGEAGIGWRDRAGTIIGRRLGEGQSAASQ